MFLWNMCKNTHPNERKNIEQKSVLLENSWSTEINSIHIQTVIQTEATVKLAFVNNRSSFHHQKENMKLKKNAFIFIHHQNENHYIEQACNRLQ